MLVLGSLGFYKGDCCRLGLHKLLSKKGVDPCLFFRRNCSCTAENILVFASWAAL